MAKRTRSENNKSQRELSKARNLPKKMLNELFPLYPPSSQ